MTIQFDNDIKGEVIEELPHGLYIRVIDGLKPNGKRDFSNTDKYGCLLFLGFDEIKHKDGV